MARETLKNNSILEITGSDNITISSTTLNPGETNQKKQFSFSGRVQLNKPTVIGTLKLTAAENKRFLKAPGLKNKPSSRSVNLGSNLRMKLKSTEKDANNKITVYLYDLIYTAKESVSKVNKLKYVLSNETKTIISKLTGIDRIEYGRNDVNRSGEKRKITIHGTPNTSFKFSVNKITESKDSSGNVLPHDTFEESILSKSIANSTTEDYSIVDYEQNYSSVPKNAIINAKLNSKGRYSFIQEFPSITSTDYNNGLGKYSLNINSTIKSKLHGWSKGRLSATENWDDWHSKIISQRVVGVLKFTATVNNVLYTVNSETIPDGASTQTITHYYTPNRGGYKITYVLRPVNSAHTFSIAATPTFENDGRSSSWSNSDESANGGTRVYIDNISLALSATKISNDTATLSFSVKADKRGSTDVNMAIALNTLVNCG